MVNYASYISNTTLKKNAGSFMEQFKNGLSMSKFREVVNDSLSWTAEKLVPNSVIDNAYKQINTNGDSKVTTDEVLAYLKKNGIKYDPNKTIGQMLNPKMSKPNSNSNSDALAKKINDNYWSNLHNFKY